MMIRGGTGNSGNTRMGRGRALWSRVQSFFRRNPPANHLTTRHEHPSHLQLLASEASRGFADRFRSLLRTLPRTFLGGVFARSPLQSAPYLTPLDGARRASAPRAPLVQLRLDALTEPAVLPIAAGTRYRIVYGNAGHPLVTLEPRQGNWHLTPEAAATPTTCNARPLARSPSLLPLFASDDAATSECIIAHGPHAFRLRRIDDLHLQLIPGTACSLAPYRPLCFEMRDAYPTTNNDLPSLRALLPTLTEAAEARLQRGAWIATTSTGQRRWAETNEQGRREFGPLATHDDAANAESWRSLYGYPPLAWTLPEIHDHWSELTAQAGLHDITLNYGISLARLPEDGMLCLQLLDLLEIFPVGSLTSRYGPLTINLRSDAAPPMSALYVRGQIHLHPDIIRLSRHDTLRIILNTLFGVMIERLLLDAPPTDTARTGRYAVSTIVREQIATAALAISRIEEPHLLPVHAPRARERIEPILRHYLWMYLSDDASLRNQTFHQRVPDRAMVTLYTLLRDHLFGGVTFDRTDPAPQIDPEISFFAPTALVGSHQLFADSTVVSLDALRNAYHSRQPSHESAAAHARAQAAQYTLAALNRRGLSREWRDHFVASPTTVVWELPRHRLRNIGQLRSVLATHFRDFRQADASMQDQFATEPYFFVDQHDHVFCVPDTIFADTLYVIKVGERRQDRDFAEPETADATPSAPRLRLVRP